MKANVCGQGASVAAYCGMRTMFGVVGYMLSEDLPQYGA